MLLCHIVLQGWYRPAKVRKELKEKTLERFFNLARALQTDRAGNAVFSWCVFGFFTCRFPIWSSFILSSILFIFKTYFANISLCAIIGQLSMLSGCFINIITDPLFHHLSHWCKGRTIRFSVGHESWGRVKFWFFLRLVSGWRFFFLFKKLPCFPPPDIKRCAPNSPNIYCIALCRATRKGIDQNHHNWEGNCNVICISVLFHHSDNNKRKTLLMSLSYATYAISHQQNFSEFLWGRHHYRSRPHQHRDYP